MEEYKEMFFSSNRRILPEIRLHSFGNHNMRQRFWLAFKHIYHNYVENTQVHGFFHLRPTESHGFKRIFWLIIIFTSFLIGAFLLAELLAQFFKIPVRITLAKPELLLGISYPAVSLCHPQTVVNYKAKRFVDKIRIPDGLDKAEILKMLPMAVGAFTENQWTPVDTNYLSTINETLQLNGLSVLDVVNAVGMECHDLIQRCSFNKKRFPCFQDDQHFTFRETMTFVGVCCSFNYNPNNLSYDPLTVNSYGPRGGLSIVATSFPHINDGASGLLLSDGYILFMHPPLDYPTEGSSMALIEVGKITSIGIYPSISKVSDNIMALPIKSRKCLTGSDVRLKVYRRSVCINECLTQYVYEKCECHPYFIPAVDGKIRMRDCTVLDGKCFQGIYYDRKKVRCSKCLPECSDVLYKMRSYIVSYSFANYSVNPIYDLTNLTKSEFTAHIFFAHSTVPVERTQMSQSLLSLVCNFGGVFNLVLGISIFSILEIFYYFCIKVPQLVQSHEKIKPVIIQRQNNIFQ